jgi:hypothetical protein
MQMRLPGLKKVLDEVVVGVGTVVSSMPEGAVDEYLQPFIVGGMGEERKWTYG